MASFTDASIHRIVDTLRAEIKDLFSNQISEMKQLFQEERQLLRVEVQEAQNDILEKIRDIHQEGQKMADYQNTLKDKVVGLEEKLDSLGKKLKEKMKENTAVIKAHLFDVNKESVTKTTENMKSLLQEHQDKLTKLVDDNQKDTISSLRQFSPDNIKQCVTDSFTHSAKEINSQLAKTYEGMKQTSQSVSQMKSSHDKLASEVVQQCTQKVGDKLEKSTKEFSDKLIEQVTQTIGNKFEESSKDLSDKLTRTKLEIFRYTEKECQLIRDGTPQERKIYICDFYVDEFKSLINSGKDIYSYPWQVAQWQSSVQGDARFPSTGDMKVRLNFGRHPREVGLEPRPGVKLKVTASVTDITGSLADIHVGSVTSDWNETVVKNNGDWGFDIGTVSCQRLVDAGFGDKEGYWRNAILIRYTIEVL